MLLSICVDHTAPGFENNGKITTNDPVFVKMLTMQQLYHILHSAKDCIVHEAEFSKNSIFILNLTEDQVATIKESLKEN